MPNGFTVGMEAVIWYESVYYKFLSGINIYLSVLVFMFKFKYSTIYIYVN